MKIRLLLLLLCSLVACKQSLKTDDNFTETPMDYSITSLLGKELKPSEPTQNALEKFDLAKKEYETSPDDVEKIIWFGRRTAYLARYQDAIDIYTQGIAKFPGDARLYRHRGHRFISIREYDKAIADFEKAAQLIDGKENEVEPDGLPNARNIPVSTLHGNIYYHLGLAHYLKQDFPNAFEAYIKCREAGSLPDNMVSSTHWLYMIARRMNDEKLATKQLDPIHAEMDIIENHSYYQLCQYYKGLIPRDSLLNENGTPSGDALAYGLANWDFYNDNKEEAMKAFEKILESSSWSSFGYLAAEAEFFYLKSDMRK